MSKDKKNSDDLKSSFIDLVKDSMKDNYFVKLTLGKYRGGEDGLENIYVTPVKIRMKLNIHSGINIAQRMFSRITILMNRHL